MGNNLLTNNPFAVLTFIAAPALLTNASCLLALSTINRLLRTRESMRELLKESERETRPRGEKFLGHVNRVERQASMLSFVDTFVAMGIVFLLVLPLLVWITTQSPEGWAKRHSGISHVSPAHSASSCAAT